jgi:hypothetical protein
MKRGEWKPKPSWKGFKKPDLRKGYSGSFEEVEIYKPRKPLLRKTPLRVKGHSTTTEQKDEIQATLREIVILRDGGCFLRHFRDRIQTRYQNCGGFRKKDNKLILQAEHLHSRSNAISFADPRLVVCVCRDHHIFYKKQYGTEYDKFAREFIGSVRAKIWDWVVQDRSPHKKDWKLELELLKQELQKLKEKYGQGEI